MPVSIHKSSKTATGPDPVLVRDQLAALSSCLKTYGLGNFCSSLLWILRKPLPPGVASTLPDSFWNKRLVPFLFNRIQKDIEHRMVDRNICLKFRQGGYTTYFLLCRLYIPAITDPGAGCLLISQNHHYAAQHFAMLNRGHRYMAALDPYDATKNDLAQQLHEHLLHTQYSRRRELVFDQLDSRILCDSAEVEEVGQGLTLTHIVGTEVARWPGSPEETLANVKEALAAKGTLDLESTANQLGGYFYEECMRARDPANKKSEFNYFFHEWWWDDEYRDRGYIDPESVTEEEEALRKRIHLDLNQVLWRRKKVVSLRHNFEEKYPEDDITAFLVSGSTFFDKEIVRRRYEELLNIEPLDILRNGDVVIFNRRIKGRRYLIGADPATGRQVTSEDTDFAAAVVLDLESGEEMAAHRAKVPPEDFAEDLHELAELYNNAMIAVERTGDGGTTILVLERQMGYGHIYAHREWYKKEKRVVEVPGFPTSVKTRPIALNKLAWWVRQYPDRIWDTVFMEEALRFVRNEKGKPEAAEGSHDDTVSARWIAHYCRLVHLGYLDPVAAQSEKYGEPADEAEWE